ncbi:TPA: hypothetical protein IAA91_00300 [Candidatus Avacholeplasma faecigallinarum]|nr:hypothetical protein [Candidatus Avacholeplasma faecigallinarum]
MNIQEKIIKNYPLINKVKCEFNCYSLAKKRYLIFWNELIKKDCITELLKLIEEKTNNSQFSEFRTIIIVGKTKEEYKKHELVYFNNVNIFVAFYLIDEDNDRIYMNDSWIFPLGLNYKKYVRKINEILNK